MKISDLFRNLADKIDHIQGQSKVKSQPESPQQAQDPSEEPPLSTMVPPLQQKIEMLKRSVGLDNVFDGTSIDKTDDNGGQELEIIKKNAGINPNTTAIMTLSDDEPLDD